jgi:CrcB protein
VTSGAGWREFAAVGAGGVLGTGLRLAVDSALPHAATDLPLATLIVNVAGSFVLAVLIARVWTRPGLPSWLRAGLGTGLLGSFTTFSALAVSLVAMGESGEWMLAAAYLAASLALGLGAAVLGLRAGGRASRTPIGADE